MMPHSVDGWFHNNAAYRPPNVPNVSRHPDNWKASNNSLLKMNMENRQKRADENSKGI